MSLKDFKILKKLGVGAYSSVYKVQRTIDNQIYALKKVNLAGLNQKQKQNALNQIRILASIKHPNIIGYRQTFFDEYSKSLCIIMEYADKGDLYQKISQQKQKNEYFDEKFIWQSFIQLCRALKTLHSSNILHRDLKSANVFLFSNGQVKLGDLNVSKISQKGLCLTQTGTPYYASPQVWKDQPYGTKSDIWSLGCIIYEMTSLHPPFQAQDMQGLYKRVLKGEYNKIPTDYSSDLNDLIRILLQINSYKRPSCQRLLNMKIVIKRMDKDEVPDQQQKSQFLKTINMPKNIHLLAQKLPKSNYFKAKTEIPQQEKYESLQIIRQKLPQLKKKAVRLPGLIKQRYPDTGIKSSIIGNSSLIQAARYENHSKKQSRYSTSKSIHLIKQNNDKLQNRPRQNNNQSAESIIIKKSFDTKGKIKLIHQIYIGK